jgi:hypothetical protein
VISRAVTGLGDLVAWTTAFVGLVAVLVAGARTSSGRKASPAG